jgi:hypothetical protein
VCSTGRERRNASVRWAKRSMSRVVSQPI